MVIFVIIVGIIIIIAVNNSKKKQKHLETYSAPHPRAAQPQSTAMRLTYKCFGDEWDTFKINQKHSFTQPSNFYQIVSSAIEKLSPADQTRLLLGVIRANELKENKLYPITISLVSSGMFSQPTMLKVFKLQLTAQQPNANTNASVAINQREKGADSSVIDVTGQSQSLTPIVIESNTQTSAHITFDQNDYRLGTIYKNKINLNTQEIDWLNKFWNPTNVFLGIEGCCIATINLYLETLRKLDIHLQETGTSFIKQVTYLQKEAVKLERNGNLTTYWTESNSYWKERMEMDIFYTIFKRSESAVREAYGHKRKVSGDFPYSSHIQLNEEFTSRIGNATDNIISTLAANLSQPDEKTEEELNSQNVNRWKIKFEQLENSFSEANKQDFIDGVYLLEKTNQKNPSIENIFFEASKFISKYDKGESLKFYIHYIHYDLKSARFDNKKFAKTIQKSLFKTDEQFQEFQTIINNLVLSKDVKTALDSVAKIYQPKRKKIQLDATAILEVEQQDKSTVNLLNEYLQDEAEHESLIEISNESSNDEIKIQIGSKDENENYNTPFVGVQLNEFQEQLIKLLSNQSFSISSSDLDVYCKSNGVFKNQLIESINEVFYDTLDDILIEEDEDNYVMNENYFKKITQQ